jgi:hypothetical protein
MRTLLITAGILSALAGCGGNNPAGPSLVEDFPRVTSNCPEVPTAVYMVVGLSSRVPDPSAAPPLEARMKVGETLKLSIQFVGCGFAVDQAWLTTNPNVGALEPVRFGDPPGYNDAFLHALGPGDVSVSVEFRGPDGRRHTTTTAYCDSDARYPGLPYLAGGCNNPKKIGIIRVVP